MSIPMGLYVFSLYILSGVTHEHSSQYDHGNLKMLSHGVIQPSSGPRTRYFELREWERWGGKNCHAMNLVAWACLSGFFCLKNSLIFLWLLHLGALQSPPQELQPPSLLSSITEAWDNAERNRSLLRKASHMASLSHWKPTLPMGQWVHRTRTCSVLPCTHLHHLLSVSGDWSAVEE